MPIFHVALDTLASEVAQSYKPRQRNSCPLCTYRISSTEPSSFLEVRQRRPRQTVVVSSSKTATVGNCASRVPGTQPWHRTFRSQCYRCRDHSPSNSPHSIASRSNRLQFAHLCTKHIRPGARK